MKPAPPERNIPKLRPLRSLYSRDTATGKREGTPANVIDRKKKLFKHANVLTFEKNTVIQGKNIVRRSQSVTNGRSSTRMARGINSGAGMGRFPQLGGLFLRPSIDVRHFHSQIMERAKRLDETLQTGDSKIVYQANNNIKLAANKPCTPKPSGLSRAYIKLSESKKKLTASSISASPFEESNIVWRRNLDASEEGNHLHVNESTCIKAMEGNLVTEMVSTEKKFSTIETEEGNKVHNVNVAHCVLNNILEHCQIYTVNMMNVNKELDVLDDVFQRVMMVEVGGQFRSRFCEYQHKKLQLYEKMQALEKELEKSVEDELDIASKFTDYLRKKRKIIKDYANVQENFENLVHEMIQNYEKEVGDSAPKSEEFEDILSELIPERRECYYKKREPILRRSKRLSATPKRSNFARDRTQAGGSGEKDESLRVKKTCPKSYDRKRIQTCIYKDLQKSFNLCSPECSF